jgi:hypothetical protein
MVWLYMSYGDLSMNLDGVQTWFFQYGNASVRAQMLVPDGSTYAATAAGGRTFGQWKEYR